MIIQIDRSFEKDVKNLPKEIQQRLKKVIEQLLTSNSVVDVGAEKLTGVQQAYKIRIGNYRIGLYKEGDHIVLSRILNRKEIYRYFPKK